jgi:catechol 2,3-dioxygenase-like lactoylglutathione lyase family enzyme
MPEFLDFVAIDHVVIRVKDLDAMLGFYEGVLGMPVERRLDLGLVQLRAGASLIDLVPMDSELGRAGGGAPDPEHRNMDHVCLTVADWDPDEIRSWLAARGVEAGPVERRYGAGGYGPSIYVQDPEGNTVELKGPADRDQSER